MASTVDRTFNYWGLPALLQKKLQANFDAAADDIEALQALDSGTAATATASDATPSVDGISILTTANGSGTTITNLDDGTVGQTVLVIAGDANTTIDFTSSTMKGNAGGDLTMATGDAIRCTYNGTNWYCAVIDANA